MQRITLSIRRLTTMGTTDKPSTITHNGANIKEKPTLRRRNRPSAVRVHGAA
jgi:hypothetical protein